MTKPVVRYSPALHRYWLDEKPERDCWLTASNGARWVRPKDPPWFTRIRFFDELSYMRVKNLGELERTTL